MNNIKPQNQIFRSPLAIFTFIVFLPNECRADAITPLFNLFTPDTVAPASILTALIVLVEAFLIRRWTKPISFRSSLGRATIINLISSAAGSIVVLLFFKEQMIWGMMGLYIPMFLLTLATETPALKFLFRREGFGWARSIKISFGINVISYLVVFIAQFGFFFAYLGYADYADKQTVNRWNDRSLLRGETGFIYTLKYLPSEKYTKYVFNRYDVENDTWEIVDPGFERGIYPTTWDVKGDIIACIIETGDWQNRSLSILSAKDYSLIFEIEGNFKDARISPDLSKLAVLEYVREITAPRDDESDFMLGAACKLKIYSLESGALLFEAPRMSLNQGISWTNDSTCLVFSSLRDESLFQNEESSHSQSYGRGYAEVGQFPIDLFIFNLKTPSVKRLTEGQGPSLVPGRNEIIFTRENGFYQRELWRMDIDQNNPHLVLEDAQGYAQAVSPSGEKYLISVPHKQPLGSNFFLTVVDPHNEELKLVIEPNLHYGFRWIQDYSTLP